MNNVMPARRNRLPFRIAAVLLAASATTAPPAAAVQPASASAAARCHEPGIHPASVPDVGGMHFGHARKVLHHACLGARAIPRAEGIVAYEVPRPGRHVNRGTVVRLHMAATG